MVTIIASLSPFSVYASAVGVDAIQNAVTHRCRRGHAGCNAVGFVVPAKLASAILPRQERVNGETS